MGALMAGLVGTLFQVGGTLAQGQSNKFAAAENARYLDLEGRTAVSQATADEEAQRREARQVLSTQAAAMAQSGMSGSQAGKLVKQSALNAELDALNIRYQGQLKKSGLSADADSTRQQGRQAAGNSGLLAAAQLISGYSKNYKG